MYRQLGHGVSTNVVRMLVLKVCANVPVLYRRQVMTTHVIDVSVSVHKVVSLITTVVQ